MEFLVAGDSSEVRLIAENMDERFLLSKFDETIAAIMVETKDKKYRLRLGDPDGRTRRSEGSG